MNKNQGIILFKFHRTEWSTFKMANDNLSKSGLYLALFETLQL
jgi:hypothetical protein